MVVFTALPLPLRPEEVGHAATQQYTEDRRYGFLRVGRYVPNNQPKPVPSVMAWAQSVPVPSEHFDGQNLVTEFQSSHTIG
jgi:hypothetical protein